MKRRCGFIMRRATRFLNGLSDCGRRPAARFLKRSRPFAAEWRRTAVTKNHAPVVAARFNEYATPRTRPIIVQTVRRVGSCSPIARSRDCYARTGPKLRKNLLSMRVRSPNVSEGRLSEEITFTERVTCQY